MPRLHRMFVHLAFLALMWLALPAAPAGAEPTKNGFDLAGARVPVEEILAGGPPRDGIRAVDAPLFVAPSEALWVAPGNPVLGVVAGGIAHAVPVHLVERHQIVNDRIGETPIAITYDPLAGAPRAFERTVDGRELSFGVSGLIYNHSFLMYDRETESLWAQFTGKAVAGPLAGKRLTRRRIRQETFGTWLDREPDCVVMRQPEPERIDYRVSPFVRYIVQDSTIFPVKARDQRFHAKEVVLGISVDGHQRAYLGSRVVAAGAEITDRFRGEDIRFVYDTEEAVFVYHVPEGVEVDEAYWLAWKAWHPDTEVWEPGSDQQ